MLRIQRNVCIAGRVFLVIHTTVVFMKNMGLFAIMVRVFLATTGVNITIDV